MKFFEKKFLITLLLVLTFCSTEERKESRTLTGWAGAPENIESGSSDFFYSVFKGAVKNTRNISPEKLPEVCIKSALETMQSEIFERILTDLEQKDRHGHEIIYEEGNKNLILKQKLGREGDELHLKNCRGSARLISERMFSEWKTCECEGFARIRGGRDRIFSLFRHSKETE